jgi:hypothetical protein
MTIQIIAATMLLRARSVCRLAVLSMVIELFSQPLCTRAITALAWRRRWGLPSKWLTKAHESVPSLWGLRSV